MEGDLSRLARFRDFIALAASSVQVLKMYFVRIVIFACPLVCAYMYYMKWHYFKPVNRLFVCLFFWE